MVSFRNLAFLCAELALIAGYILLDPEFKSILLSLSVAILFVWFSLSLFISSMNTEKTVISYDLMSVQYAKTMLSAYREIVGYRISSILSILFFSVFIFVKLYEEPTASNILEVILIFGGVISLQIFHLLDLINHEPEIMDVENFLKKTNPLQQSKQVKLEGKIVNVKRKNIHDFELIDFDLTGLTNKGKVDVTYLHRELSAAPQIMEGSRIRLHGDYFVDINDVPVNLRDLGIEFPKIVIVEGYGTVEEIAFLYDETSFQREYKAGAITLNMTDVDDILKNRELLSELLRITEVGENYTADQIIEMSDFSADEVRHYLQLMVQQKFLEPISEPFIGYKRLQKTTRKTKTIASYSNE